MKISFVVAVAKNGVIGSHNDLPFYIPEDLKHFKKITDGHTVLMGRNTFNSIMKRLGKPLPNRRNVVVTHQKDFNPEGVLVFHSLDEALAALAKDTDELMVAGGAQIYKQLAETGRVDKIYMTEVHKEVEGDVLFPQIDLSRWKKVFTEPHQEFTWVDYEKE
ncbi:MAG TPA: dihydrofolate reductase [Patescibacteria group bacterium]|jgi:dihydrofolate reductase|nr:dihydrofolate reductase [Patescibacteria group bacterium]